MAGSPYIFESGAADFQENVVAKSASIPVLVDFWAGWCAPCRSLAPILEKVAGLFAGRLLVAKVDTDAEPELAARFGVRSLPTLLLFHGGEPRAQTMGVQPESAIVQFVRPFVKTVADDLAEQGADAVNRGDMKEARRLIERAVAEEPERPGPRYALAEFLLAVGDPDGADAAIDPLSVAEKESNTGHMIRDRIRFARDLAEAPDKGSLARTVSANPGDLEARYLLAARLLMEGSLAEALEQFYELMRRDRNFRDDAGRNGLLSVFNILGPDSDLVTDYRKRMAALLH